MVHLAIDLLGADTPEEELCRGAVTALRKNPDLYLHLFGHAARLQPLLAKSKISVDHYEIVDCPGTVTNEDASLTAYEKKDASIVRAMQLAKDRADVCGVITCGSTGAVLVSAIMILGKIRGMRPVLAVEMQSEDGKPLLLLDCGANIDSRAELLLSFARLGNAYMKSKGQDAPRIALLSNGREDTKGCETVKEANALLRAAEGLHFIGNIEATDALRGETDVIVCDGFHGNILLKSIEGTAKSVLRQLQKMNMGDGAQAALDEVYRRYDFNAMGGAVLLGVNKLVMKGHGAAKGDAIANMIAQAYPLADHGLSDRIRQIYAGA